VVPLASQYLLDRRPFYLQYQLKLAALLNVGFTLFSMVTDAEETGEQFSFYYLNRSQVFTILFSSLLDLHCEYQYDNFHHLLLTV
jgi:hypothetical protein